MFNIYILCINLYITQITFVIRLISINNITLGIIKCDNISEFNSNLGQILLIMTHYIKIYDDNKIILKLLYTNDSTRSYTNQIMRLPYTKLKTI